MSTVSERLVTIAHASRETGIAEWTLRRLIKSGAIRSFIVGGRARRVRLSDVFAAIESR